VEQQFGSVAPGIVQYTTDVLFRDLWLRPDLAPRNRRLVTVSALIASGQVAQITYHLNRAMAACFLRKLEPWMPSRFDAVETDRRTGSSQSITYTLHKLSTLY
jgi:hypothetical protein